MEVNDAPTQLLDRFDGWNMPSTLWERIRGGHQDQKCGIIDKHNSLYFGGEGTREAVTMPLDTRHKKLVVLQGTTCTDYKLPCMGYMVIPI